MNSINRRLVMPEKKWRHDDLLLDLAEHLSVPERMLWTDMQLGPFGSPRPDVYTMRKSYAKPSPLAYEIKISVSDFRSDITSGKWQSYLEYAQGIYFCVPQGLITKEDVPKGCGLMIRGPNSWRSLKKPTLSRITLSEKALLKLLIDGVERNKASLRDREINTYFINQKIKAKHGELVARVVQDYESAQYEIDRLNQRVEAELQSGRKQADDLIQWARKKADDEKHASDTAFKALKRVLGLGETASKWNIVHAAEQFLRDQAADERVQRAHLALTRARDEVSRILQHEFPEVGK